MYWKPTDWKPISQINNGKKYTLGNPIKLSDINAIFNNIFFMKGN